MVEAAKSILTHGRSAEADDQLMSITEILDLIPGTR
jgi:phosphoenolpyruvate phosphomutase